MSVADGADSPKRHLPVILVVVQASGLQTAGCNRVMAAVARGLRELDR